MIQRQTRGNLRHRARQQRQSLPIPNPRLHLTPDTRHPTLSTLGLRFLGWSSIALLFATQNYIVLSARGDASWLQLMLHELPVWWLWGLSSLAIVPLARRFPVGGAAGYRNLVVHIPAAFLFSFLNVALFVALALATGIAEERGHTYWEHLWGSYRRSIAVTVSIYGVIVTAYYALQYYRAYQQRERLASQLEARLAESRLDVLRMQIHPHFLFNTLHGISALMSRDVPAARRMIARLSDLLRLSLEGDGTQEVTLEEELGFLDRYIELQQMRFGDRLQVERHIEGGTLDVMVPRLLLQPLVENSIRHGLSLHAGTGVVEIVARIEGDRLQLIVRDNGPGISGESMREGVGLRNTRERIEGLYGEQGAFELRNREEGGLDVTITVPARRLLEERRVEW